MIKVDGPAVGRAAEALLIAMISAKDGEGRRMIWPDLVGPKRAVAIILEALKSTIPAGETIEMAGEAFKYPDLDDAPQVVRDILNAF